MTELLQVIVIGCRFLGLTGAILSYVTLEVFSLTKTTLVPSEQAKLISWGIIYLTT